MLPSSYWFHVFNEFEKYNDRNQEGQKVCLICVKEMYTYKQWVMDLA